MSHMIRLSDVVDAFEMLSDHVDAFLNASTGEVRMVTQEATLLLAREPEPASLPEWQLEELTLVREVLETEGWLQLPSRSELHEWRIMERFALEQSERWQRTLLGSLEGRGAFRAFRNTVERLGLRDAWFAYRRAAFEAIARDWLRARELSFA